MSVDATHEVVIVVIAPVSTRPPRWFRVSLWSVTSGSPPLVDALNQREAVTCDDLPLYVPQVTGGERISPSSCPSPR